MRQPEQKLTVAAVHAASASLDLEASVEKACGPIAEAAGQGRGSSSSPSRSCRANPFRIWTHTLAQSIGW